jgi:hypothetical protein
MLPAMRASSHLYEHTVLKIKRPLSLIPHACRMVSSKRVAPRVNPLFVVYRFRPLLVEALAAIGRALSNHS